MKRSSKQNNRNRWLYLGIGAVVLLLIIGGVVGYNYWQSEQRNERANETVQTFTNHLENQNYADLSEIISPSSLEEIDYTREDVEERYETIYGGIGAANVTAENIQLSEDEESGQFTLTYDLQMDTSLGELDSQTYETTLQEAEDTFQVNWDTDLIFPQMETEDTVQIQFTSGNRGDILDRNGELLAGEGPVWQAGLHPALLGEGETREENLQIISETFDTSVEQLENLLQASWVTADSFVPLTIVDDGETPEVTGVVYQETTARTYPLGEAGAHLLGYVGEVFAEDIEEDPTLQAGDVIGKAGLEQAFDDRLRGSRGGEITIQNSDDEIKETLQEAPVEDGEDITLTIDASLQEEYFDNFNDSSGAAVVTEPTSGELLVLTSSPSYDPTLMARGISNEEYQAYADNPETPFLPRYTARYAPASTFKVITAAIGLDTEVTTLDETRTINGFQWQKDDSWGNHQITRVNDQPTEVTLEDALVYSDNIFFAQEAVEMGSETFMNGLVDFPFDENFELPISMQSAQITNSGSFDSEVLMADTAYGQGQLLMSPLHQAIFYSPFINSGELVFPKLEAGAETPESTQPITQESADTIREILTQVVEDPNGTAHALNNAALTLAAKTGTSEIQAAEEGENDTNGFLLAFDAENSSYLSLVFVEDSGGSDVTEQFAPVFE